MVNSAKVAIVAAALSAAALAVPLTANTDGTEENIEAREPMLPPPGGFKFDWRNRFPQPILAGLKREVEAEDLEARGPMIPPPGGFKFHWNNRIPRPILDSVRRDVDSGDIEAREPIYLPPGFWDNIRNNREPGKYRYQPIARPVIKAREFEDGLLEAREPILPIPGVDGPPVGWMSPWWKGRPVGESIRLPQAKPTPKRDLEDYETLVAREPIPPPPPGFERPKNFRFRGIRPIAPTPEQLGLTVRDADDYDVLEAREPMVVLPGQNLWQDSRWRLRLPHGVGPIAREVDYEELEAREPIVPTRTPLRDLLLKNTPGYTRPKSIWDLKHLPMNIPIARDNGYELEELD